MPPQPPSSLTALVELRGSLADLQEQVRQLRWSVEAGQRPHGWLAEQLYEVERELEELEARLRAAERQLAAPREARERRAS